MPVLPHSDKTLIVRMRDFVGQSSHSAGVGLAFSPNHLFLVVQTAADADDYSVECAICYEYELDSAVPDIACDGCSKPFHRLCLAEWLQGLPTTQTSFNRLFGECVYCSKPITVESGAGYT